MKQKKKNKKITTIGGLAVLINNGFQTNQEYMDKKFDEVDKELKNIRKDIADVVRNDKFEKLETRMDYVENALNLPKK